MSVSEETMQLVADVMVLSQHTSAWHGGVQKMIDAAHDKDPEATAVLTKHEAAACAAAMQTANRALASLLGVIEKL